jgi:hypothetical protein
LRAYRRAALYCACPLARARARCAPAVRIGTRVAQEGEPSMSVAKVTEIIASSPKSFEDAIEKGIQRAAKTLKNVQGAWIESQKVVVDKGKVTQYRVNLRVTFVLE